MNYFWGQQPRSTYHKTMVSRVKRYLKKKCTLIDYEKESATGSGVDAYGYNKKSKTWYLCEIKVDPSDLKKAPQQILNTKFLFPMTKYYHAGDSLVMVVAITAKLANYLLYKKAEWTSLYNHCKMINASIWVIEQSKVREVFDLNIYKAVKIRRVKASLARKKGKTNKKAPPKKAVSKKRVAQIRKTKITKKKTTRVIKSKPRKIALRLVKAKKPVTKSTSRAKISKTKPTKKKR